MTIYFDMDGTIADFYGVDGWLEYLHEENPFPYVNAKPLVDPEILSNLLNRIQQAGITIGIISWLSKTSTPAFDAKVTIAKQEWLNRYLKVEFDEIHIVKYGTPKYQYCKTENDILFDDEIGNRNEWTGQAFDVQNILEILKGI